MTTLAPSPGLELVVPGVFATKPTPLPFDPSLSIRSFVLERERGNVLIYGAPRDPEDALAISRLGGLSRRYLGHGHEAMFLGDRANERGTAPLFLHAADAGAAAEHWHVRATFTRRHTWGGDLEVIPIPGHTPGSTAYLWNRVLFTSDSIFLRDGEWRTAVLGGSDPVAYARSLELLRELDFDVLVPWAASGPAWAPADDARARIDALLARLPGR
jgi:glyoxylase-like metal-dependent hydrolase (beta-lactamase superfamily II)